MSCLPLLGRDCVGDFSAVGSVVHEEEFNIFWVSNEQLFEPIWQEVSGLSVGSLTDTWHHLVASVLTSDSAINTVGFSPRGLKTQGLKGRGLDLHQLCNICQIGNGWRAW